MPFEKNLNEEPSVTSPPCIHLRSKAMYVTGEHRVPDHPDEEGTEQHCWCNMTQHILGPDQIDVSRPLCVEGRDCFKKTY